MTPSAIRRKPVNTYKSPSMQSSTTDAPVQIALAQAPKPHARPTITSVLPRKSVLFAAEHIGALSRAVKPRAAPPLPLYHPLGPLALSLPDLDPALFGLPSALAVDDGDAAQDAARRASSRARRPAAKVRERDDDEQLVPPPAPAPDTRDRAGTGSPRRRRAGGGAKRKRKEADDADSVYPPPAKRTRNPRGAGNSTPSVASPLVGAAMVAQDVEVPAVLKGAEAEAEAEAEEAPVEPPPPAEPKRTSRSRKSRAAASRSRRRNSSASETTTTSVSVSVAANTRKGRGTRLEARAQDAASEKSEKSNSAEGKEEEEVHSESRSRQGLTAVVGDLPAEQRVEEAEQANDKKMKEDRMHVEVLVPVPALVPPSTPVHREEKEEGELSDEPEEKA